ncbi:MAG TPA: hypothetical protein DEH24_09835 [Alteromonas sp.]|nr:hypothetical protein [Alteromonas sp.]
MSEPIALTINVLFYIFKIQRTKYKQNQTQICQLFLLTSLPFYQLSRKHLKKIQIKNGTYSA